MSLWREIRVEPILFLFCLTAFLYANTSGNLLLQKTCFPAQPPGIEAICTDEEKLKEVASLNSLRGSLREALPIGVVLAAGAWRDRTGLTRPLMVIGHVGELVTLLVGLAAFYRWDLSPWVSLLGDTLPSVAGGRGLVTMAAMAYIAERTSPDTRAQRMAGLMVATLGAVAISSAAGGYLLEYLDYRGLYFLLAGGYLLSLVLTFALVQDEERRAGGGLLRSLANFKVLFRSRPNTAFTWAFLLFDCLITAILSCEGTVSYLFLHKALKMKPQEAGLLGALRMVITLITAAVVTPLLKKLFHLSDLSVAFICTLPSIVSGVGLAFSTSRTAVYLFTSLDLMRIVLISTLLSLITKTVKKTEIGTYMSFLSAGEAVLPLALNPLYAYVFNHTLDTLPGAFYLISASVVSLGAVIILVSCFYYKEVEEDDEE